MCVCVCVCFSAQGHDAQNDAGEGRTPALLGRAVFKGHHASFTPCITLHISELGPENAICPPFLLKPPPVVEQQCEILWACGVVFRVRDGQDPRIPNFHPSVLKREEPRQGRPVPESQGELTAQLTAQPGVATGPLASPQPCCAWSTRTEWGLFPFRLKDVMRSLLFTEMHQTLPWTEALMLHLRGWMTSRAKLGRLWPDGFD